MAIFSDTYYSIIETITGGTEDDTIFIFRGGINIIDGGSGIDSVVLFDKRSIYTIDTFNGITQVNNANDTDKLTLTNVERIQFSDEVYAINGNSTDVGKTIIDTDKTTPETLEGGAGNDIITEFFGGDDVIDGKAGTDTVVFFDYKANFDIKTLSGFVQITAKTHNTATGITTDAKYQNKILKLISIEKIKFIDEVYIPSEINYSPVGSATATLADSNQTVLYIIKSNDLLKGFTDPNNDLLKISHLTVSNGTITLNSDNISWTFTPAVNQKSGSVSLNYEVTDGKGGSVPATQKFNLIVPNQPPTGSANFSLSDYDQTGSYVIKTSYLTSGFTDPDNDTLTIIDLAVSSSVGKLFDNGNQTWTFIANVNENKTVNLTYKVTDNKSGSISATQKFELKSIATLPSTPTKDASITIPIVDINQDTSYKIPKSDLLLGFDNSSSTLKVSNLVVSNGVITNQSEAEKPVTEWIYTPLKNFTGSVILSYNVIDESNGGYVATTRSFNLIAVNASPIGYATASLPDNNQITPYILKATDLLKGFTDSNNDTLAISNPNVSSGKIASNGDDTWTFTPSTNIGSSITLTYKVIDNKGGSIDATQSFNLFAINNKAPIGNPTAILADNKQTAPYLIKATDLLKGFSDTDGDTLAVTNLVVRDGTGTELQDKGTGVWTFTPTTNSNSVIFLNYTVTDGKGGSTSATQSFNLIAVAATTPVNNAPTGNATFSLLSDDQTAPYIIKATDLTKGFTDPDNDSLIVKDLKASTGTLIAGANNTWTFIPDKNVNSVIGLTYNVSDNKGGTIAAAQSFELLAFNNLPIGSATAKLPDDKQTESYLINATDLLKGFSDPNNDPLVVDNLTASSGTLENWYGIDSIWVFTPAKNENKLITLSYNVIDNKAGKDGIKATQSFNLVEFNNSPKGYSIADLPDDRQTVPYIIRASDLLLGFTDKDGDTLTISDLKASNGSVNGTVDDNLDGTWTFTPSETANLSAYWGLRINLTYNVIDNKGGSVGANEHFYLYEKVNSNPVNNGTAAKLPDDNQTEPYIIKASDLLKGFSDPDGDSLTIKNLYTNYWSDTLTLNADNTWTFVPSKYNPNKLIGLTYTVTDNKGGSVEAAQSFNLIAINDAPIGTATAVLPDKKTDAPYIIKAADLLKGFSDPNKDTLAVSNLTASNGTLIDNKNDTWTFKPSANTNDTINLTYNVIDNKGGSIEGNLSFNLFRVNHLPFGFATATLPDGFQNTSYKISADDLLNGFDDPDNDTLSVSNLTIGGRNINSNLPDVWTYIPPKNLSGEIELQYNVTDGKGGSISATQILNLIEPNHKPFGDVTIQGIPKVGQILTVQNTLTDANGLGVISYQWLQNNQPINDATQSSYLLTQNDLDKTISVKASYIDGHENFESVTSQSTLAVNDLSIAENKTLKGTAKNNALIGENGNDTLIGGLGADTLTGGEGADVFSYNKFTESTVKTTTRDTITDFNQADGDKIDLSAIDADSKHKGKQLFSFIEEEAFSNTNATAQLRFDKATHILYGSVNADNKPEFAIFLSGVNTLSMDDFMGIANV